MAGFDVPVNPNAGGGSGGGVTTFNGRSGAVTPQSSDYNSFFVDVAGDTMAGNLDMGSNRLLNLPAPLADSEPATKGYADALLQGLHVKASVRATTTAALAAYTFLANVITANANGALGAQDGVTLIAGNSLLVKDETAGNAPYNGIYIVTQVGSGGTPFILTRRADANSDAEVTAGMYTFVVEGTTYADSGFVLSTNDPIVLNTTALTFTQFSGAGQIVAGSGLSKTGNTLDVNVDGSTIEINADALRVKVGGITGNEIAAAIKDAAAGTASLRTLGTSGTAAAAGNDIRFNDGIQTLTDAATVAVDWSLGRRAKVTITAARTLGTPTNPTTGAEYVLEVIQDGTGGWELVFPAAFLFTRGPHLAPGAKSIYRFIYDGTNYLPVGDMNWRTKVVSGAGTYTLTAQDHQTRLIFTNAAASTVALLALATAGRDFRFGVKQKGAGTPTVDPSGAETIDGAATKAVLGQFDSLTVYADSTEWGTE